MVILQITDNAINDSEPAISGSNIVWSAGSSFSQNNEEIFLSEKEIFLFDGSEIQQITQDNVEDKEPKIFGNNVVWIKNPF